MMHLYAPPGDFPDTLCGLPNGWGGRHPAVYGKDLHLVDCPDCLAIHDRSTPSAADVEGDGTVPMTDAADRPNWLQRWADRRMYRDLARSYEQDATQCRRNAHTAGAGPPNGIIPGADFWNEEALHYLDKAVEYRDQERALR